MKRSKAIIVLCAFVFGVCFAARGDENKPRRLLSGTPDYEREMDETYAVLPGAAVVVRHSMGDVEVAAWEGEGIRVQARIEVKGDDAERFGGKIRIEIDAKDDPFTIRTEYPSGKWEDLSFGVSLKIEIPVGHSLDVKNSFGDIGVSAIRGAVAANVDCGDLEVRGVEGELTLQSSFGKVMLKDSRGKTTITGNCGAVDVEKLAAGDLHVNNKFGAVKVGGVAGGVDIDCANGEVSVERAASRVKTEGSFGELTFKEIGGPLVVSGKNSTVIASGVAGPVTIETSFGNISLRGVRGDCRIHGKNGSVSIEDVEGNVAVENLFGPVSVAGVGGSLRIESKNGSVDARVLSYGDEKGGKEAGEKAGKERKGNRIELISTFGLIDITLPDPPSFRLDASTSFGRIKSDFELSGLEKGLTSEKCSCRLGAGAAAIILRAANGDIRIRKAAAGKARGAPPSDGPEK